MGLIISQTVYHLRVLSHVTSIIPLLILLPRVYTIDVVIVVLVDLWIFTFKSPELTSMTIVFETPLLRSIDKKIGREIH